MRFRRVALFTLLASCASSSPRSAGPPAAPTVRAEVGLPDATPARFVNVTIQQDSTPWTMDGCVSNLSGSCFATQRVPLTADDERALRSHLDAVARMPLCEPEAFAPGDPAYTVSIPSRELAGHLPANAAEIEARTAGPCGAPARLAWWIAQRFTAGTR